MEKRKCLGSWVDTYLEYTKDQESPLAFHTWTAISVLSACLGRSVWIPRIKYTIYPNLYVVLVAASAQCRKSVALGIGRGLLGKLDEPPMVFAQKITAEALIQALESAKKKGKNTESSGLIFSSELAVFLGADSLRNGVIPALTDLYDSPKRWEYHTRGRGKEVLENVTLGMLAATTRDGIQDVLPKGAITGGFTSRVIFVYQDKPAKDKLFNEEDEYGNEITETMDEIMLREMLLDDLNHIRALEPGPIRFSKEAKRVANDWYTKERRAPKDEKLDGYFGRKHDTMFKVAAILSIAESDKKVIEAKHINRALRLLDEIERSMGVISASILSSTVGEDINKILQIIRKAKIIGHSELIRKTWRIANALDITNMVRTLIESGEVKEDVQGNKKFYKIV